MHDVHVNHSDMGSRADIGYVSHVRRIMRATATLKSTPLFVGEIDRYPCFITFTGTLGSGGWRLHSASLSVGVYLAPFPLARESVNSSPSVTK